VESELANVFVVQHHWSLLACDMPILTYTSYVTANSYSLQHNHSGVRLVCLYPLVPSSVTVDVRARENTLFVHICNVAFSFVKTKSIPREC
jgi:multisubunit Na+/H+ antiporter MnhE subunit